MTKQPYQPMWDGRRQKAGRASITVSETSLGRYGLAEASRTLLDVVIDSFLEKSLDKELGQYSLDALQPAALLEMASRELDGLDELQIQGSPEESLARLRDLLKAVLAGRDMSPAGRIVNEKIEAVCRERVAKLCDSVRRQVDVNPTAMGPWLDTVQVSLSGQRWTPPDPHHRHELERLVNLLEQVNKATERLLPEARRSVVSALVERGRRAFEAAWKDMVVQRLKAIMTAEAPKLDDFIREQKERSAKYARQLKQLETLHREHQEALHGGHEASAAGVCLALPGPSRDEILTGMKAATRCQDLGQLVERLRGAFGLAMKERARESHPHLPTDASAVALLTELPAEALLNVWRRVIEEHLGSGHSLYQQIAAYGVQKTADFLFARAAPTCYFAGHDHRNFGMPIQELVVVTLPPATRIEDQPIRAELVKAFRRLAKECYVPDVSANVKEIRVARIRSGWVIAADASNSALLERYVRAGRSYAPHLFDLVPDALNGQVSPGYVTLLRPMKDAAVDKSEHHQPQNGEIGND